MGQSPVERRSLTLLPAVTTLTSDDLTILRHENRRLRALVDFGREVTSERDLRAQLRLLCAELRRTARCAGAAVILLDPEHGAMVSKRFHHSKPPTILDVPVNMQWEALDIPDPETPVGARGIGEPPVGGGCASILNALSDALGDEIFRRAPVNADTILTSLEAGRPMQHPLMAHI